MRANYDESLALVLKHEGGWVFDRRDPGGETNKGITQQTYDLWRVDHQLPKRSVKYITPAEICALYKSRFWDKLQGDQLPSGLDYCLFDFAVNSGPVRAAKYLQEAIGADVDGKIGAETLFLVAEVTRASHETSALIDQLCDMRQHFLERLPTFGHFGKGWTQRAKDVRAKAREMAR